MSPRLSDLFLSSQSDERLTSLARAGHERAFAAIVERYRPELQAMARRLCADGRSEDVVQQAFLSAFTALRSGSEVRHLRGWLYQIVRNAAGRPPAPACVPLEQATGSDSSLEDLVQQRVLAMAALSEIARLPARQRQAIIGTALDGRPRAEIASSMGLSEGAVRQLVHRARTTLRGAVTALTPWPLARWIAAAGPDAPGPPEVVAGAGAASAGGLALKLGALLASGTFLTGAAVHLDAPRRDDRGAARVAASGHARAAVARAEPQVIASVARPLPVRDVLPGQRPAGAPLRVSRSVVHGGRPHEPVRHDGHGGTPGSSGERLHGSPVDGPDGGRGSRTGAGRASGHDGIAASGSGEGFDGRGSGQARGSGADGGTPGSHGGGTPGSAGGGTPGSDGGGPGSNGRGGAGSNGRGGAVSGGGAEVQMVSGSNSLDSALDGSGSRQGASSPGSGSRGGSGSGFRGGPGAGSGDSSAQDGGTPGG